MVSYQSMELFIDNNVYVILIYCTCLEDLVRPDLTLNLMCEGKIHSEYIQNEKRISRLIKLHLNKNTDRPQNFINQSPRGHQVLYQVWS